MKSWCQVCWHVCMCICVHVYKCKHLTLNNLSSNPLMNSWTSRSVNIQYVFTLDEYKKSNKNETWLLSIDINFVQMLYGTGVDEPFSNVSTALCRDQLSALRPNESLLFIWFLVFQCFKIIKKTVENWLWQVPILIIHLFIFIIIISHVLFIIYNITIFIVWEQRVTAAKISGRLHGCKEILRKSPL